MSAHGSRFTGGYQFPRTDSATLVRQAPILREHAVGPLRADVELVPLTGSSRGTLFDLAASWTEWDDAHRPTSVVASLRTGSDEEAARRAYRATVEAFRAGVPPEGFEG